jgi:hypothetical protein
VFSFYGAKVQRKEVDYEKDVEKECDHPETSQGSFFSRCKVADWQSDGGTGLGHKCTILAYI